MPPGYLLLLHLGIRLLTSAGFVLSGDGAAFFIFGDSFFDAGNNNYINTTIRANFPPYGETFFRYPTGRSSDGRLVPDFIAGYAKLPFLPPYKEPRDHRLADGVNFASAGGGVLVETYPGLIWHTNISDFTDIVRQQHDNGCLLLAGEKLVKSNIALGLSVNSRSACIALSTDTYCMVIDLKTQLGYFKDVVKLLKQQLGEKKAEEILSRAVYFFNVGSNDYTYPFLTNSSLFESHSNQEFVGMVVRNLTSVIKEIYNIGGRKFASVNLGPLGCFPFMKVLVNLPTGECLEEVNSLVKLHNDAFSEVFKSLEVQLKGFKYSKFDFHTHATQRMNNPSKYGFKEGMSGCCGSGRYRGLITCGGKGGAKTYELCSNASEYFFFDAVHPSDVANQQFSEMIWEGTSSEAALAQPYSLEQLFHQE